jgi:hypothetical protein
MEIMEFLVCRQGRYMRWIVRLDNTTHGAYLDREQAPLDAVEAARDARESGRETQVLLPERRVVARAEADAGGA